MKVEIIQQPLAGEYEEKIYDLESPFISQNWTWIKFTFDDFSEVVGQFRGNPLNTKFSEKRNEIIVLTTDAIFRLDATTLDNIEIQYNYDGYTDVEVSPQGIFIFCDYYMLVKMDNSLSDMTGIGNITIENIKFGKWQETNLEFECIDICADEKLVMILDTEKWEIHEKK